jgi:hypothetical protein
MIRITTVSTQAGEAGCADDHRRRAGRPPTENGERRDNRFARNKTAARKQTF